MERKDFYEEQVAISLDTGSPTKYVETVALLLFNPKGELFLQKRSYHKNHNPGLIDKSIGGHIESGDSAAITVMFETIQELKAPSIVFNSAPEYNRALNSLWQFLSTIAVIKKISITDQLVNRVIDDLNVTLAVRSHLHLGVYNGSVQPVDGEVSGFLWYRLEDLVQEMKKAPALFTTDLQTVVTDNYDELVAYRDAVCKK